MSKTSLFLPLTSLFTALLFCIFQQEYKHLNPLIILGFALHLIAIWLFRIGQAKAKKEGKDNNYAQWLLLTTTLIVVNTLFFYFMKLVTSDVPKTQFLPLLYSGCLVYFGLTFLFNRKETVPKIYKPKLFLLVLLVSLLATGFTACTYWIFQENDGITSVSFVALSSTFVPVMTGWVFFGEGKGLSRTELVGFLCGVIAAILIVTSH